MAVRSSGTLTPFSIQAILNKKEERGGLAASEGRPAPGGTEVAVAAAPAVCCWRLFGETEAGALGGAEDSLLASPARSRTAVGQSAESPGGWDSDSALSEETEGRRRCADVPGASGAGRARVTLGLEQPGCELHAAKDLEEEAPVRSDSEMSASVSGLLLRGFLQEGGWAEGGGLRGQALRGGVGLLWEPDAQPALVLAKSPSSARWRALPQSLKQVSFLEPVSWYHVPCALQQELGVLLRCLDCAHLKSPDLGKGEQKPMR